MSRSLRRTVPLPLRLPLKRPLAALLATCLAAGSLDPVAAQVRLPSLGETASEDFSVAAERRMGEQIMREIRRDPAYLEDAVLQEYLLSMWEPLLAAARARGAVEPDVERAFAWEAFLVRDRSVNAFALPGGYVGVHLGLIAITATTDELASVLAHELSHVTQRHIARNVGSSQRASMIGLAAILLGVLAASRSGNADLANAAIMGGQGAAIQGQLNFSRDMEREADRIGYQVLRDAGFSPQGMGAMFEKLDGAARLNDSGNFPYLRTHPLTVERMAEARSRAVFAGEASGAPPLRHALMQARARVLMDTSAVALRRFDEQAAAVAAVPAGSADDRWGPRERAAALYAGALAASLQRRHDVAERQAAQALAALRRATPREPAAERSVALLQAETRLAAQDPAAALRALDEAPSADGSSPRPAMLLRAQARLDLQRREGASPVTQAALRQSTEALSTWLADHPQDAAAWAALAGTAEGAGQRLRALRAGAEAQAARGDLNGAIDRLRAAQQVSRQAAGADLIEASVIDARLRDLQAQRRALALEARGGRGPAPGEGTRGSDAEPAAPPPPPEAPASAPPA